MAILAFEEGSDIMSSSRLQPRKQPRQDRAEATRRRILEAAAHVFADFGYAAGTTNRIAERAEISIGSLYQYFPNKDAILVELMTAHTHRGSRSFTSIWPPGCPIRSKTLCGCS